jgi:perosamine synthetase
VNEIPMQRPCLGEDELAAVREVFASRWLGMGPRAAAFEQALRELLGVKHVLAVNTGTAALHLALDALGLRRGDEVILPSLTFIATAQAVLAAGATPVFCEVQPDTLTLDVADAARRITRRTRALLPVHYAGLACEMDEVLSVARDAGLRVVEDAAHAFGSLYKGRKVGTLGDATCFSFDPIKNITCGEGGAVATDDDEIADRVRRGRVLGMDRSSWDRQGPRRWSCEVATRGYRYHLSDINAAIGLRQLPRLAAFKARKQAIVRRYDAALSGLAGVRALRHTEAAFPFLYVVRVSDGRRDDLMSHLKERKIGTGVHYVPNHLQPLFRDRRQHLPVTEQLFGEVLTLPLYFEMTDGEVDAVIAAVRSFAATAVCVPVIHRGERRDRREKTEE